MADHGNQKTMSAWICRAYGGPDVLVMERRPRPVPRADELLVRVHATTVSSGDARIRAARFPRGMALLARLGLGITRPRKPVLGVDFAGIVEAVGSAVSTYKPGDAVLGMNGMAMGGHAEYLTVRAAGAVPHKPAALSFAEAVSLCFGGTTAMHFIRKAELSAGERILVIGASGAVGSAFVQLARHRGAHVTAVTSTGNADMVTRLGAHEVIDYTRRPAHGQSGAKFDVIADTVGATTFRQSLEHLNDKGRYLAITADLRGMLARRAGTKRSISGVAAERAEDINELVRLAEEGGLRPVIDCQLPFDRLPEAHAIVDTGRKRGSVVINVVDEQR